MRINSFNIFGISGGIGHAIYQKFLKEDENYKFYGTYFKNNTIIDSIKLNENLLLQQINLVSDSFINELSFPNYDCIIYAVGASHFCNDIFDFKFEDLRKLLFLDIIVLMQIIKQHIEIQNSNLKKVIIIGSSIPTSISSIYHLSKSFQYQLIDLFKSNLCRKNISLTIIKSGWIDTKMYADYLKFKKSQHTFENKTISPYFIADVCYQEVFNNLLYNIVEI